MFFPQRFYDVGIAEPHAVTTAAGLASAGLHPVVAIYAPFLNRAFDQLLLDVALHRLPVTVVLDRAGITGEDGPTHHGVWDYALLGMVPGLRQAAPRDEATLRDELREAVSIDDGPTVVRFPKTPLVDAVPTIRRVSSVDVICESTPAVDVDVLLVSIGALGPEVLVAARDVVDAGFSVRVVDPRWVLPLSTDPLSLAEHAGLVVSIEDGVIAGGVGSRVAQLLRSAGIGVPTREIGVPAQFLEHGKGADVRARIGLSGPEIGRKVVEWAGYGAADRRARGRSLFSSSSAARRATPAGAAVCSTAAVATAPSTNK